MGIETELGVTRPGINWMANITFMRNLHKLEAQIGGSWIRWDARQRLEAPTIQEEQEHHQDLFLDEHWLRDSNLFLPNGARFYPDGPHAELSSPLSLNPRQLVTWNRALYRWIDNVRKEYKKIGQQYTIYRNNVGFGDPIDDKPDYDRSSWACHLNLGVPRRVKLQDLVTKCIPWFVLQTPFSGAGKVGSDNNMPPVDFQISQRADFFTEIASHMTTHERPLYNLRDVAYADQTQWRRMHIIPFDSNMLELPEYLKCGLTAILVSMIRDGVLDDRFAIYDPLAKFHEISWDTDVKTRVWLVNRRQSRSVTDCLWEYCDLFADYLELHHPENTIMYDVVMRFYKIIQALITKDWGYLYGKLDWVTKKEIIENALNKKGKAWKDDLAYKLDTQYHDNDHERGMFFKVIAPHPQCVRITDEEEIVQAIDTPPPTRSRWIAEIRKKLEPQIYSSDYWYRITLEDGERLLSLFFGDPSVVWNEEEGQRLLALPLTELMQALKELGIIGTEKRRIEDEPLDLDYLTLDPSRHFSRKESLLLRQKGPPARSRAQLVPHSPTLEGKAVPSFPPLSVQEPDDLYERSMGHLEEVPPTEETPPVRSSYGEQLLRRFTRPTQ